MVKVTGLDASGFSVFVFVFIDELVIVGRVLEAVPESSWDVDAVL
jgi:hypothetical protein